MSINIILATDLDYGIGNENKLPWPKNKRDMEWFRKHTLGGVVVMGRKTWESIGSKPLPNRKNVVITSKALEGVEFSIAGDMGEILDTIQNHYHGEDIWIIGGAEIYNQTIPYADKLYLTTFNGHYTCDAHVESDIIVKFPFIEFWKEDPELIFQIRSKNETIS